MKRSVLSEAWLKERIRVCPKTGCWLWTRGTDKDGYGMTRIFFRMVRGHRAAWELYHGPIPPGMGVLHKCDTPPCCNPEHLFLGTNLDNQRDARAKGRKPIYPDVPYESRRRGERVNTARLTASDVVAIRQSSKSNVALAKQYGISSSAIGSVRKRETWKHIP